MTVLTCGIKTDPPIAMLLDSLEQLGIDNFFLDLRDLADHVTMEWRFSGSRITGSIQRRGEHLDISRITAVYHRLLPPENISAIALDQNRLQRARAVQHSIIDLFDILPVNMVNSRRPMMSNNSKPLQTQIIRDAGFFVPDTLITNDPDALSRFMDTRSPLIYKSMSSVRSIVSTIDGNETGRIDRLRLLPTQFQEKIEGVNVRVHVIGRQAVATKIETNAVDYRYPSGSEDGFRFVAMELDQDTFHKCINLANACGLVFCGIDLMIAKERTVCLEINPCPAYSVYQEGTGQPISDMLARYLANGTC